MNAPVFIHKKEKLGTILIQAGKLQASQLDRALAHQETVPHRIGEILISLGYISEENLAAALAEQLDLALYDPAPDEDILTPELSQPFLRDHPFLLLHREEANILITSDPLDSGILAAAEVSFAAPFAIQIASEVQIKKMLREHYNLAQQESDEATLLIDEADIDKLKDMASEAPVIKYVNNLIDTAVGRRASDIHMEPFEDGLSIRFRIDGILHDYEIPPHALQPAIISRSRVRRSTCGSPPCPRFSARA
jgi:general secretion pathway protein E